MQNVNIFHIKYAKCVCVCVWGGGGEGGINQKMHEEIIKYHERIKIYFERFLQTQNKKAVL